MPKIIISINPSGALEAEVESSCDVLGEEDTVEEVLEATKKVVSFIFPKDKEE